MYVANVMLENVNAAITEYYRCNYAPYYGGKITYNISSNIYNMQLFFISSENNYVLGIKINNDIIWGGSIYTFNDEYLVIIASTQTTGTDGHSIYVYDMDGNNVFKLENVTLNYYDENNNLMEKTTYTQHCSSFWYNDEYEVATFGEIKYDIENKEFINNTEEKSVSEYCKDM